MENKYKIGDIVVIGQDNECSVNKPGDIGKIITVSTGECSIDCGKGLTGNHHSHKNIRPATPEEIAQYKKDNGIVDEVKFEVGKWYKYNKYIGKYKGHNNDVFQVSEYIYDNRYYSIECNWGNRSFDHQKVLLTDLSEIQKYLPDGHVDKIKKDDKLTYENLVEDEYYYTHHSSFYGYIFKYKKSGSFNIHRNEFFKGGDFYSKNTNNNLRLATDEEKEWLEACIKADRFIPKEEVMKVEKSDELTKLPEKWCIKITQDNMEILSKWRNSLPNRSGSNVDRFMIDGYLLNNDGIWNGYYTTTLNKYPHKEITFDQFKKWVLKEPVDKVDDIPEYVECIRKSMSFTVGKIYKLKKENNLRNGTYYFELDDKGSKTNGLSTSFFKPSTKEAYDMQNGHKTYNLLDVEVGDTIRCIDNPNPKHSIGGGVGWSKGYEFLVDKIDKYPSLGHNVYFPKEGNGVFSEFVELVKKGKSEKELTKEKLLEEAKRRYPVGTKFYPAHLTINKDKITIVKDELIWAENNTIIKTNRSIIGGWTGVVYHKGTWAEIISLPEDKIENVNPMITTESNLDKANRMFKVGMEIKTPTYNSVRILENEDFPLKEDLDGCIYTKTGKSELYNSKSVKWATIESTPQQKTMYEHGWVYHNSNIHNDIKDYSFKTSSNLISYDDEPMVLDMPKRVNSISTKLLVLED